MLDPLATESWEPLEEKEQNGKKGGIIIPDTAKEKPRKAWFVGPSAPAKPGTMARKYFSKSKKVTVCSSASTAARKSKLNGKGIQVFNGDEVLAIIDN